MSKVNRVDISEESQFTIKTALINDSVVSYDACSSNRKADYSEEHFRYIGKGKIHTIDGIDQESKEENHFWVYR
ncbi:MAG: hypothetical protein GY710_06350 [Desulfobacteraceae bacterium]|nr:hypothetical protein [Desulfobacteraceae bacterium]